MRSGLGVTRGGLIHTHVSAALGGALTSAQAGARCSVIMRDAFAPPGPALGMPLLEIVVLEGSRASLGQGSTCLLCKGPECTCSRLFWPDSLSHMVQLRLCSREVATDAGKGMGAAVTPVNFICGR